MTELVEPDDWTPIGLPADDVARRTIMRGASEALETGGIEGMDAFLRNSLGGAADSVIREIDKLLGFDADSLYKATQVASGKQTFTKAGHALQKHGKDRPRDVWQKYLPDGTLNPANYNAQASALVQDVLTNPETIRRSHTNRYGESFIDYFAPDGRGLRFTTDGSFHGFVNP